MVTDPKTTVGPRWAQVAVVVVVALVEMLFRLAEIIYAPMYALFLVGPCALLLERWLLVRAYNRPYVFAIDRHRRAGRPRLGGHE